jgi:hypothetical protein
MLAPLPPVLNQHESQAPQCLLLVLPLLLLLLPLPSFLMLYLPLKQPTHQEHSTGGDIVAHHKAASWNIYTLSSSRGRDKLVTPRNLRGAKASTAAILEKPKAETAAAGG